MTFSLFSDDDEIQNTVAIPVRVEKGKIRLRNGMRLPRMVEGAEGVLIAHKSAVLSLAPQETVEICPAGTELLVSVRAESVPTELQEHLFRDLEHWPDSVANLLCITESEWVVVNQLSFVPITLGEALCMELSASSTGTLRKAACNIPALGSEAISINQAYTFVSEKFEPHRAAHTGNVFDSVFVKTKLGWKPLEFERKRLNAEYESQCKEREYKAKRRPDK
jgi:hypothetical protein